MMEQIKTFATGLILFILTITTLMACIMGMLYIKHHIPKIIENIFVYGWVSLMTIGGLLVIYKIGYDVRNK